VPVPDNPAIWLVLVDAIILVTRMLLPEKWSRYCAIAVELEEIVDSEAAARHRLLTPRSVKVWAALDWDAFETEVRSGYHSPYLMTERPWMLGYRSSRPPMTPGERRAVVLAREGFRLEEEFEAAFIGELQAGLWDYTGCSEQDGREGPPPATWRIAGLTLEPSDNAIKPGKAPRWIGLQFRRKNSMADATAAPAPPPDPLPEEPDPLPVEPDAAAYVLRLRAWRTTRKDYPSKDEDQIWGGQHKPRIVQRRIAGLRKLYLPPVKDRRGRR
jgi:hypothetical protein